MITCKQVLIMLMISAAAALLSCATVSEQNIRSNNKAFLDAPFTRGLDKEAFRVVIMSDTYQVVQVDYQDTMERQKDPGGDRYICDEMKKYDKIDEFREGMYHVSLYPDRGTLRKVRPFKPLNLIELDNLVLEDLQRWSFKFPKGIIIPNNLYIKYRVVLRKRQSDKEIFKEVEEKMNAEEDD